MTTLNGKLTTCGPGQYFSLQFTCNGPSCAGLTGFPNTTCVADATNTNVICSNGVTCPGPANYTTNFNLSQTTGRATQSYQILLPDFCEEIDATSDGTTNGINAHMIITGPCGPPIGNSTVPSGNSTTSNNGTSSSTSSSASLSATSASLTTLPVNSTSIASSSKSSSVGWNTTSGLMSSSSSATVNLGGSSSAKSQTTFKGGSSTLIGVTAAASSSSPRSQAGISKPSAGSSNPSIVSSKTNVSYPTQSSASTTIQVFGSGGPKQTITVENVETLTTTTCPVSGSTEPTAVKQTSPFQSVASLTYGPAPPLTPQASSSSSMLGVAPKSSSTGAITSNRGPAPSSSSTSNALVSSNPASGSSVINASSPPPSQSTAAGSSSVSSAASTPTTSFSITPASTPSSATTTPSTVSTPSSKTSGILFSNGSNSIRAQISLSPLKLISLILCFLYFVQGTVAFSPSIPAVEISSAHLFLGDSASSNTTSLELSKRANGLSPGWEKFAGLFAEYLAGKITTPELADNLVDEIAEAVCDHAVGVVITKTLGVDLVEACVAAIDVAGSLAALGTLQPEIEFAAVLGSGILCNLLVSEALPGISELTDAICKHQKPCSEDLLTDINNCGRCNNTMAVPHVPALRHAVPAWTVLVVRSVQWHLAARSTFASERLIVAEVTHLV
ncbi:hypothetical protein K432DRAFT_396920 [Lepidopterella palustris CBS 459.81]|uniref:Uncharacterized protein n=1 Tax=Lepidopterella palustris CBS 459.81 TaxID=1314670 RepID=A0A8E2E292_9PEZI|nr:hypothetical protein K432DRAFT_396920 [Lepidopterella palustris CBS 459.81]